jgi:transcriptional regulatory protein LevR
VVKSGPKNTIIMSDALTKTVMHIRNLLLLVRGCMVAGDVGSLIFIGTRIGEEFGVVSSVISLSVDSHVLFDFFRLILNQS